MNKALVIIQREYLTRVRSKVFLLVTLLMPVVVALIAFLPVVLVKLSSQHVSIAVIDKSGLIGTHLKNTPSLTFHRVEQPFDSLVTNYTSQGFGGILHIPATFDLHRSEGIRYFSDESPGLSTMDALSQQLNDIVRKQRWLQWNIQPELLESIQAEVSITTVVRGKGGHVDVAALVGFGVGFLLYLAILLYGTQVMTGVMEEKTNRIAEVIISSVKAHELMIGKIVGIALVGLTQFAIWIGLALIFFATASAWFGTEAASLQKSISDVSTTVGAQDGTAQLLALSELIYDLPIGLIAFGVLFYFLFGYLLYSSLFAAVGAASGDQPDQALSFLVSAPVILSFLLSLSIIAAPHGKIAVFGSLFPLSAPIIMPVRLAYQPPAWQIVLSMALLLAGFAVLTWLSAKVYRTGILLYGKKITLREVWRWIRY